MRELAYGFSVLNDFERKGLIHWQSKDHLLLIEERLAITWMATGEKGLNNCLNAVGQWQNFKLIQEAYETHRINIETEAVRKARKPARVLTNDDIARIRQEARDKMPEIDPATLKVISEFDIMVIRASAPSSAEATEANGQLVAVGHYDGEKVEMAMYEDIKHTLNN